MASTKDEVFGDNHGGSTSANLWTHEGSGDDHGGYGNDHGHGRGTNDPDHDHDNDHGHGHDNDHDHDPPCYHRGTFIRTPRGEVRVEDLAIGDMVTTITGEAKPIKWIGRRSYTGKFVAGNPGVLPIVVRADGLAPEIPVRDLWLSPGHALLLDWAFVPAEYLVNGLTIQQARAVDQVEYFHLEFERHEVILADGAPAESYVECDNRWGFQNAHEFAALYPNDTRASFDYCLPRLEAGTAKLAAIRARLLDRAAALGHPTTTDPDLHLVVNGTVVAAQSIADGRHTFRLDRAADEVWLASRCGIPAELNLLSRDRRCLGVCVKQLVLRDDHSRLEISHSHPALCEGFHENEENERRWTTGMGRVPKHFLRAFADGLVIEVHCLPPMQRYHMHPQIVAIPDQSARSVTAPPGTAQFRSSRHAVSVKGESNGQTCRRTMAADG
jgi:Hint domain